MASQPGTDGTVVFRLRSLLLWWVVGFIGLFLLTKAIGSSSRVLEELWHMLAFYVPPVVWLLWTLRGRLTLAAFLGPFPERRRWVAWAGTAFGLAVVSFGSGWLLAYLLSFIAPDFVLSALSWRPDLPPPGDSSRWALEGLHFLSLVCLAPLLEESLFRGVILSRLTQRVGLGAAVVLSSLVFGLLHMNVLGMILFGMIACGLRVRSGTLWVPIVVHAINNLAAWLLGLASLLRSGPPASTYGLEDLRAAAPAFFVLLLVSGAWLSVFGVRLARQVEGRGWRALYPDPAAGPDSQVAT